EAGGREDPAGQLHRLPHLHRPRPGPGEPRLSQLPLRRPARREGGSEMVISGLVFQCDPGRTEAVLARLTRMPELSDITPGGQPGCLVGVLESPSTEASVEAVNRLRAIPGVY